VTWKGPDRFLEEGHGAALGLIVLDRQMDEAGGSIDGDIKVALAALAILGAQLGQVLPVQVHEAEVVGFERAIGLARAARRRQAAQALGFQDAVDRVAVQMRQKVSDHEGEVIEREAGCATQGAHNGPLFLSGLPGQLVRTAGVVLAVGCATLAPLADRLGGHAIALGQHARGLGGMGDLGPDGGGGAGPGMNRRHQDLLG
jgi:hypothetical protein